MADIGGYNPTTRRHELTYAGARLSGRDASAAEATEKMSTTRGQDLGSKARAYGETPKQRPGESLKDYAERVRKNRMAEGQRQALSSMK